MSFWFDIKESAVKCAIHPPRQLITWATRQDEHIKLIDLTDDSNVRILSTIFSVTLPSDVIHSGKTFIENIISEATGSSITYEDDFSYLMQGLLPDGCVGFKRRTEFSSQSKILDEFMIYKDTVDQHSITITNL